MAQTSLNAAVRLSLAALFKEDGMRLSSHELSLFLKESLKLPHEMRLLLLLLAMDTTSSDLQMLLQQNLKQMIEQHTPLAVSLEDIQALLDKNTKEAKEKLMKLLQANQISQTQAAQQLAELTSGLGKLGEKIKASPQEALETLMLLYIPWYPLAAQQKLELSFEFGGGGEAAGEKDISVVIFLETNTLGRFKIVVYELEPLQVGVRLFHEDAAKYLLPTLEDDLNEKLAAEGLPAAIVDAEQVQSGPGFKSPSAATAHAQTDPGTSPISDKDPATAGFKGLTRQADQKQITIQPGEHVSLLVLNSAYTVVRLILEADEQNRLLQKKA